MGELCPVAALPLLLQRLGNRESSLLDWLSKEARMKQKGEAEQIRDGSSAMFNGSVNP